MIIRRIFAALFAIFFFVSAYVLIADIGFGNNKMDDLVGKYYIENTIKDTTALNVVSTVVVNYRGLDTLGEVTVLFVASVSVGVLMARFKGSKLWNVSTTPIHITAGRILFPLIWIFGAYIFVHGHLTPGGGFPGGAVIASGVLLLTLAYKDYLPSSKLITFSESISGSLYVLVGLIGLAIGGYFLYDFVYRTYGIGTIGTLISGGFIPIVYTIIGVKVGVELSGILHHLSRDDTE